VPTLAEILSTLEPDAAVGERRLELPGGELVVWNVGQPIQERMPAQGQVPTAEEQVPASEQPDSAEQQPDAMEEQLDAPEEQLPGEEPYVAHDDLSTGEVRRRAVTGAVVDALRGSGVRIVALLGTLVTARLLTPYDFGLVAIGTTALAFGSFLDDGGVGQALIRRPEPPRKSELQALLAFQFGLDLTLVLIAAAVMLPFGLLGRVTTVVVLSLPFGAFRAPAYILYERRLNYRPMAVVEVAETTAYYVWAIATIAMGWGVWGLATAFLVKAAVGLSILLSLCPEGRMWPVPSWRKVRALLAFGFRFQAVNLLHMLRDQGVNVALAIFGGVSMLGLWNVAWRILQIPVSLFQALWRVSFPGMSRLVAANEDVGSTVERVIALVAIGTGVLVVPLAAASTAWIHVLIGAKWATAASAIPPACFAMMFGVPISVALSGYLWAIDAAEVPLRATAVGIPATLLLLVPLLPVLGIVAVGIAYIASSLTESLFFVFAARRTLTFRIGARLTVPLLLGAAGTACGWLVARSVGPDLAGALAGSAVSVLVFLSGLGAVHRADVADAGTLILRGLRGVVRTPADSEPQPAAG
jgi:O-antigen/teichoic acid export membrane protein